MESITSTITSHIASSSICKSSPPIETKDIETIEVQEVIAALRGFAQQLDRHAESTTERAFSRKPKCHGCNQFGHFIKDCDQANKAGKLANFANQVTEPATMFYACHSATIGRNMYIWYVDSSCSNHMTSHESLLINVDKNVKCRVKMGTRDLVQSIGKGTLVIEMKGVTRYIKEVMIVPGLDENLLSVGQMVEHGNRCFPLSLEYVNPLMANRATVEESSWVWHRRYGHLNCISLMLMQEKEMVQGLPRLQGTGQHKSQVFNIFKRFKSMVELQSGYQIKKLRSNRGGEYTSLEFSKFCEDMGLERELTVAYCSQQNGVVERKNRNVIEMARTMMFEKKIPLKFWAEAVNTAVYL
ncbi:hypothetical protein L3X38_001805 [Prunus dulcis]|uniref:Uncharacterized protein n=1 Tax=Prunus dulcis TaxID=3755 RepID=A0AAD4WSS7_PRUDU|nr:hypothetical protein L3X38_001805 [Prunus dulcis]